MNKNLLRAGVCGVALSLSLVACSGSDSAAKHDPAVDEVAIHKVLDEIALSFNEGRYDDMFALYQDDVVVTAPGAPEIIGKEQWRAGLAALPANMSIKMRFDTKELVVSGDLAYEKGTFTMDMADKATGQSAGSVTQRHVHIFKRQADGNWKGWRLMENSAGAAAPAGPPQAPSPPGAPSPPSPSATPPARG